MGMNQSELARKIGVARETLSRALSGSPAVSDSLRARILEEVHRYNYKPNSAALAMRNKRHQHVGVLTNNPPNRPHNNLAVYELILGISQELDGVGYAASLFHNHDFEGEDLLLKRAFRENLLDGMLLLGNTSVFISEQVSRHFEHVVHLECNDWGEHNCLRRDEIHSGRIAAQALLTLGCKRILYTGSFFEPSTRRHYSATERFQGAREVMDAAGIEMEPVNPENLLKPSWKKKEQVGILAYDMISAHRFAHTHAMHGRVSPKHYRIVCCDERHETHLHWPHLLRVENNRFDLGRKAARMFLQQANGAGKVPSEKVKGRLIGGSPEEISTLQTSQLKP